MVRSPIELAANMFAVLFCAADVLLQNLIMLRSGELFFEFDFFVFHEEAAMINA